MTRPPAVKYHQGHLAGRDLNGHNLGAILRCVWLKLLMSRDGRHYVELDG